MEDDHQQQQTADHFAELERDIRRINIDGETIELTYHLRKFAEQFQRYIADDRTLSDLFSYLNRAALADGKFAVNMAAVFASRQLDDLVIKETKLRNAMLTILQQNFQSIDSLKHEGLGRFYNSITLLGEYYHRKKFANGKRILILGQSLLLLLTTELENEIKKCEELEGYTIDPEFAKVILTQVTLNGGEAKTEHKQEIDDLNYSIRKCLINVGGMSSRAKAYLLMALDLFYTNFNLGQKLLEKLYGKYLFEPDEDTSTKPEGKSSEGSTTTKKEETPVVSKQESNSTGTGAAGSKSAPKKPAEKTDQSRKQRNSKPAPAKPRRKEEPLSPVTTSRPPPSTPPKKSPQARVRPALNHTSPRKDQHQQRNARTPAAATTPKSPLQRRTPPEKLKQLPTTPPPLNPSVLKQNCKVTTKNHNHNSTISPNTSSNNSNSPGSGHGGHGGGVGGTHGTGNPLKLQMPASGTGTGLGLSNHEDNVENLAWDDLTLEDESPQKINPHTKSFLSFLAQK